jgi:hypothetical protein
MVAMDGFDHLLHWKLKRGSHYFPGQDGGTCLNEAAVVAAGFTYQRIASVHQMPECFSRPICALAMWLNDFSSDEERQRLLPYVTRLACVDTPDVEQKRADYIARNADGQVYALPFDRGLRILEEALAIGRQADPLGPDEVRTRMEAAWGGLFKPTRPAASASAPDKRFALKVKSWLSLKETERG